MGFLLNSHREVAQVTTWQDPTLGIMKWGFSNSFPQTFINFISQSANAYPTISRTAQFYKGAGFEGEDLVVTPTGLTLKDVVSIMAEDYAYFKAFSLHGNYDMNYEISSINPMRISTLRYNQFDELNYSSKIGYHSNFGLNSVEKKLIDNAPNRGSIKWFNRFNPDKEVIAKQIENSKGGLIGNYNGQILYHSDSGHSSYPVPPLQAPINFVLSDIENSILVRKETSTGFTNTYLLKTALQAEDETLLRLEESIAQSQGSRGSGRVITFADLSPEEINSTILEEIGTGGSGAKATVESAILTYELDQRVIIGAYLIPPILAGVSLQNGFTGVDLSDSYDVFNAITQPGRDLIEQKLNKFIQASVFKNKIGVIKIKPLSLNTEAEYEEEKKEGNDEINPDGTPKASVENKQNAVFTDMSGRQMQNLQRVVKKFNKEDITEPQARQMLQGFGLTEEQIDVWLPKEDDKK